MSKRIKNIRLSKKLPKKLKWGVAGCGHFLENSFLPTFQHLKKSNLVSVYSSNLKRAQFIKEKFGAENSYNNYAEFLNSDIEAIYISSKNSDHYQQVIDAANAGKHILCEKPLSITYEQAKEMVEVCEKNNVILTINYVFRHHPIVKKTKEFIDSQLLGKIVSISAKFNFDYKPNDNFRFKIGESGGGALRDLGTHMIDLLRYLGGEITSINGKVDNIIYNGSVDDFATALVKFENGGYGDFNVAFNISEPVNRVEILGHKGTIIIDNMIGKRYSATKMRINLKDEGRKLFRRRADRQLYLLRDVQKSFLKNETPLITAYDGLVNMQLMTELEKK
jgi:D-xylose 1-dehydrogenase (NADP+, D-xylono-1,5-lactone-forming)